MVDIESKDKRSMLTETQQPPTTSINELPSLWKTQQRIEKPVQFITDTTGTTIGALLDMSEYQRLSQYIEPDPELIIGFSRIELQALAMSKLALPIQTRVDELLAKNAEAKLSPDEDAELDDLLEQIDQLTILKTRSLYTLHHMKNTATI